MATVDSMASSRTMENLNSVQTTPSGRPANKTPPPPPKASPRKAGRPRQARAKMSLEDGSADLLSMVERKWRSYLRDQQASEMKEEEVLRLLSHCDLLGDRLTKEMVLIYLSKLMNFTLKGNCLSRVASRASIRGITYIQFESLLHWIAQVWEITYSELVGKIVDTTASGGAAGSLRHRMSVCFHRYKGARSMTTHDFTRFCSDFRLFVPSKFSSEDVTLLFVKTVQRRGTVNFEAFLELLRHVAQKLQMGLKEFCLLIVHRDNQGVVENSIQSQQRSGATPGRRAVLAPVGKADLSASFPVSFRSRHAADIGAGLGENSPCSSPATHVSGRRQAWDYESDHGDGDKS